MRIFISMNKGLGGGAGAISKEVESSADQEIAVKQKPGAADPMQSDRKPL
jgi:hypothetical protein